MERKTLSENRNSRQDSEGAEAEAAAKRARIETMARYGFVFAFPFVMVVMMVSGYLGAMHAPTPHDLPVGVVGATDTAHSIASSLDSASGSPVDVRVIDTVAQARQQILEQDIAGALVVPNTGTQATIMYAQAAGSSQSTVVKQLLTPTALQQGLTVTDDNLSPLPSDDGAGLAAMFMALGLMMAGYMPLSLLLSNAPELLTLRRIIPILAGWSAILSIIVWLIAGPVLGAASGHTAALLGIGWLAVFAVGSVQLLLTRILGPIAALAGLLFIMVLGTPAANLGMSVYTMPSLYRVLHDFLPLAATGESFRSVLYFDGVGAAKHLWTLAIGAVVALALVALIDALRHRKNPDAKPPTRSIESLTPGRAPSLRVRYIQVALFPIAMVTLVVGLMLSAMQSPTPREVPIAVTGATVEQTEQTIAALQQKLGEMFALTASPSTDDATKRVRDQDVAGAYVLPDAPDARPTLIVAGATGSSQVQVVTTVFQQIAAAQNTTLAVDDIAPLPKEDSSGAVGLYTTIGWIMSGFLLLIVMFGAAPSLIRSKRLIPISVAWSLFMSFIVWMIAGPIIGGFDGHALTLIGVGTLTIFSVSMFTTVFVRLIGMLAVVPVVAVMMFLGVPSSNGALSIYLEPNLFRNLHDVLVTPAALQSVRSVLYFGSDGLGSHVETIGIWGGASLVIGLVIEALLDRRRDRRDTAKTSLTKPSLQPLADNLAIGRNLDMT